jgi:hypothetical protein
VNPVHHRLWRLALALAAGLVLLAPSCPQGASLRPFSPSPSPSTEVRVVLFGDSLTAMSESTATGLWAAEPTTSVSYNGVGGTFVQDWAKAYPKVTSADTVIVALGTNNLLNVAWNTGQTQAHVRAALAELSEAKRVIWVNLNTTEAAVYGPYLDQRVPWFNAFLAGLAESGEYPNLVVADWATHSAGHEEWLSDDDLHYNTEGTVAYGEFLHWAVGL